MLRYLVFFLFMITSIWLSQISLTVKKWTLIFHKNKNHRENISEILFEKYKLFIKSFWNLNTRKQEVNRVCYNLWAKKYQVPLGDTGSLIKDRPLLRFQKKLSPWKIYRLKILQCPWNFRGFTPWTVYINNVFIPLNA